MSGPHPDPLSDMLSKPHELDGRFEREAKTVITCISDAALTSIAVSLKRIADAMTGTETHLGMRDAVAAITAWNTRPREAELEAEMGRLRVGVRRALTYMDPMSPGHSSKKMADARRVLQVALSTIRAAKT